jgi:mono/diheme cytochrome c family protein
MMLAGVATLVVTGAIAADPARDAILAAYAREATNRTAGFEGFSRARGERLYLGPHAGGNPETPACAACHGPDPRSPGRHVRTGRTIAPMAVSADPGRFTDAADIEKRFARDCPNVLGRPCTAEEKGDFITFLAGR